MIKSEKKLTFFPIGKVVFSTRMVVFLHILCSLLELKYFYEANKLYFNLPKLKNFCSAMSFHTLNTIKKNCICKTYLLFQTMQRENSTQFSYYR